MRYFITLMFGALLVSLSLLSTSCSKDSDDEPKKPDTPGSHPGTNKDYPAIIGGQSTLPPSGYYFTITYPKNATEDWVANFNFYRTLSSQDFPNTEFTTYDSHYVFKVTGFSQNYSPVMGSHTAAELIFTVKPFDMNTIKIGQQLQIMSPYDDNNGVLHSNSLRYASYKDNGHEKNTLYQYGWWNQAASGSVTVAGWDGQTLLLNVNLKMWTNASTPHYINIKGQIPYKEDNGHYVELL